ncbi:unnamed protein product [Meloidogyne enterolobii]|uniref:Uncharacterized protein n=1 Tax=Meloidogyne enterolobii TaxID=390850 RepID=A0ACB1A0C5_MELEN
MEQQFVNTEDDQCIDIKEFLWTNSSDLTSLPIVMGFFAFLYSAIVLTSLLGNLLVILSVCQYRSLQSVRNLFIVSLSVSDIVISVVSGTITPIVAFTKIWPFGQLLCKWVPVIQGVSLCFSTLTLTSISVDRFLLIVTPLKPSIQKCCACRIVALNCAIALAISIPILFNQTMVDWPPFCGQFCTEDWSNSSIQRSLYGTFVLFTQFVFPFLIITSCYVMISIKINSGMRTKRCSSTEIAKFSDYCSSNARCDKFLSSSFGTDEGNSLYLNEQKLQNGMLMAGDGAMKVAMDQRKMVLSRRIRTNRMLIVWNPILYALLNEQFRLAFSEIFKQISNILGIKKERKMLHMQGQLKRIKVRSDVQRGSEAI